MIFIQNSAVNTLHIHLLIAIEMCEWTSNTGWSFVMMPAQQYSIVSHAKSS